MRTPTVNPSTALRSALLLLLLGGSSGCGDDSTSPPPCWPIHYRTIENQTVSIEPAQNCYEEGTNVTATASSGSGWIFVGWSGSVSSTENPLSFRIGNASVDLVANYAPELFSLDVDVTPAAAGQVEGPPLTSYQSGDRITLTAVPSPGYTFQSWSGGVTSTANPLTVTIVDDLVLTATFQAACYDLTVEAIGPGTVQVDPDQACYGYGTNVTLQAVPQAGSDFVGWSGDASGTANPLAIVVEDDMQVTATFATPLTVTFHNPVFTDIEITVADAGSKTIPPSSSVDYYFPENPGSISVTAQTGGKTVQSTPIGLLLGWDFTADVTGTTDLSVNLIVPSDYVFLYFRNQGTVNLGPVVVNAGTSYETVDDIVIPNDGLLYRTGYYHAFSSMQVRAWFPDQMTYVYWTEGTHFFLPGTDNQSVQLTNNFKGLRAAELEHGLFAHALRTLEPAPLETDGAKRASWPRKDSGRALRAVARPMSSPANR